MPGCPRLLKEYKELRGVRDSEIDLRLVDESDIFQWTARLAGPQGTPYAGGYFDLKIICAPNYPLAPPRVTFVTPVFHPNVLFKTGEICLDILKPDAWTPAWTQQSVCRAVAALLSHPEADSPLNCDCGKWLGVQRGLLAQCTHTAALLSLLHPDSSVVLSRARQLDPQWRHAWLSLDGQDVHLTPRNGRPR